MPKRLVGQKSIDSSHAKISLKNMDSSISDAMDDYDIYREYSSLQLPRMGCIPFASMPRRSRRLW